MKKILILGTLLTGIIQAYTYNIYLNFDLKENKNIAKRYNKIITDTINIVKKYNNENQCKFNMDGENVKIECKNLTKETIPLINDYVNKNIYNQKELLSYKIIRQDQEIGSIVKRKAESVYKKIKSFFK